MYTDEIMQEINSLLGMENFKRLCSHLQFAANNVRQHQLRYCPIPNLIFAVAPGCGTSRNLRLLTELLKALSLLQFSGEEDCFEWMLGNAEEAFEEFLERVDTAAGFYGQFCGVIGLHMSQMLGGADPFHTLERLMEYVNERQGEVVFVFIVPDDIKERHLKLLYNSFVSATPVELIRMPFPVEETQNYITRQLQENGFTVSDEAQAVLRKAAIRLDSFEEFAGYHTLQNLSDVISWRKLSQSMMQSTEISEQDVAFIFAPDGYFSQLEAQRKAVIGFSAVNKGCT